MTNDLDAQHGTPLRPLGSVGGGLGSVVDADVDTDDEGDGLPEHEHDDDRSIGGGVMSAGGTAVDRGTGTLDGVAQTARPDGDDVPGIHLDEADEALGLDRDDD